MLRALVLVVSLVCSEAFAAHTAHSFTTEIVVDVLLELNRAITRNNTINFGTGDLADCLPTGGADAIVAGLTQAHASWADSVTNSTGDSWSTALGAPLNIGLKALGSAGSVVHETFVNCNATTEAGLRVLDVGAAALAAGGAELRVDEAIPSVMLHGADIFREMGALWLELDRGDMGRAGHALGLMLQRLAGGQAYHPKCTLPESMALSVWTTMVWNDYYAELTDELRVNPGERVATSINVIDDVLWCMSYGNATELEVPTCPSGSLSEEQLRLVNTVATWPADNTTARLSLQTDEMFSNAYSFFLTAAVSDSLGPAQNASMQHEIKELNLRVEQVANRITRDLKPIGPLYAAFKDAHPNTTVTEDQFLNSTALCNVTACVRVREDLALFDKLFAELTKLRNNTLSVEVEAAFEKLDAEKDSAEWWFATNGLVHKGLPLPIDLQPIDYARMVHNGTLRQVHPAAHSIVMMSQGDSIFEAVCDAMIAPDGDVSPAFLKKLEELMPPTNETLLPPGLSIDAPSLHNAYHIRMEAQDIVRVNATAWPWYDTSIVEKVVAANGTLANDKYAEYFGPNGMLTSRLTSMYLASTATLRVSMNTTAGSLETDALTQPTTSVVVDGKREVFRALFGRQEGEQAGSGGSSVSIGFGGEFATQLYNSTIVQFTPHIIALTFEKVGAKKVAGGV